MTPTGFVSTVKIPCLAVRQKPYEQFPPRCRRDKGHEAPHRSRQCWLGPEQHQIDYIEWEDGE